MISILTVKERRDVTQLRREIISGGTAAMLSIRDQSLPPSFPFTCLWLTAIIALHIRAHTYIHTYIHMYMLMCARARACTLSICKSGLQARPRALWQTGNRPRR